jgi:hypothetical protein
MAGLFRWQAVVSRLFLFAMFLAVSFLTLSCYLLCRKRLGMENFEKSSRVERERLTLFNNSHFLPKEYALLYSHAPKQTLDMSPPPLMRKESHR